MKIISKQIRLSATDVSNHLACRHLTVLELSVARGARTAPEWAAPDLQVIRELGLKHEADYLAFLTKTGLEIVNFAEEKNETKALEETRLAMQRGADVIYQGALGGPGQFGRPDILRKVAQPSELGNWSYEAYDCKLARETKATTILQLSFYSELLAAIQGQPPERMWVVVPGSDFVGESHRIDDYAAYYRYVKVQLASATKLDAPETKTYPEPCSHCDVCRWFGECDKQRRSDDHLSLVAGLRRQQQNQLELWDVDTVAKLAALPIPITKRPEQGSREGLERVREQARVQVEGREKKLPVSEPILPIVEATGFCRLPEPTAHDLFLDFEGDPFVGENGLQYLTGLASRNSAGEPIYEKHWALNREEEKKNFEWLIDRITLQGQTNRSMHVYHFGSYEPGALKRLMGMYATREDELDCILRAGVLVDLHQIFKQALRAGVEEYSLKKLEAFYAFERKTPLAESRAAMRFIEHRLELGREMHTIPNEVRAAMEGYNSEDCFSTLQLQDWLESQRQLLVESGIDIARPPEKSGDASEKLQTKLDRTAALTERLLAGIPADPHERSLDQSSRWLLAQLLSWHRREDKRAWQEGYEFAEMDDEDLLDERVGLTKMKLVTKVDPGKRVPTDRYSFEPCRNNVRIGKDLYFGDIELLGECVSIDQVEGTVDVKKTGKTSAIHPPTVYVWKKPLPPDAQAGSLYRIGEWAATNPLDAPGRYRAGRDLLLRKPPRLIKSEKLAPSVGENPLATATRVVLALQDSVFAIQGPPGSGKTYTGARMICELVKQGRKIGVTALSHKVIRNLLDDVVVAAEEMKVQTIRCMHRDSNGEESEGVIVAKKNPEEALQALKADNINVLGGTSWLWSTESAFECVDVLFVDEAGQMSLADVLAVSQAAEKIVLLGDPQQLERPLKGSHPDGAEKSALEHLLGARKTIPNDMGLLLPESRRLHPKICSFTSELFYEGKLSSHMTAHNRVLAGHPWLDGAGLWFVPVNHQGNRNSSAEEINVIEQIVTSLSQPSVKWFYGIGNERSLKRDKDILIVSPYNAQVADLSARLPDVRIGTVDKFQGQEAPVVIYSLTTSSPEDAPRGMEFLYSLNRLNVATSRAMSNVILVGSPKLMEPECRTPRHMLLANALCRYAELATTITDLHT
jgi:predicted RecB family nuclease